MSHWSYPHVVLHALPQGRIYVELHAGHSWKLNVSVNADAAGNLTPTLIATSVPSSPLPAPAGLVAGCTGYVRIPFNTPVETFLAGGLGWIVSVKMMYQCVDLGTGPREYSALLEARVVAAKHPDMLEAPGTSPPSATAPVSEQDQWVRDSGDFNALLSRFQYLLERVHARKSVADILLEQNISKARETIRCLQLLVGDNNAPSTDYSEGAGSDSHPRHQGDTDSHSV